MASAHLQIRGFACIACTAVFRGWGLGFRVGTWGLIRVWRVLDDPPYKPECERFPTNLPKPWALGPTSPLLIDAPSTRHAESPEALKPILKPPQLKPTANLESCTDLPDEPLDAWKTDSPPPPKTVNQPPVALSPKLRNPEHWMLLTSCGPHAPEQL